MAAAVALAQAGIDVQVYEQAQQLTEVGAGVSLAPNGLRMLERLGVGEGIGRLGARYASTHYRGLVPRLDEHPADAMRMWVGESKHFLVYPVPAGQPLNYVGFVPSDTSVRESWSAPGDPAALAAHLAGWDPAIGQVIAAISGPGVPWPRTARENRCWVPFDDVDGADLAEAFGTWRSECASARERVAAAPSLDVVGTQEGREFSLRWIMIHMIEEYARHNGHADLLRQRIDGAVGV